MRQRRRLKHLKVFSKSGTLYVYHRPSGTQLSPKFDFMSPDFLATYAELEQRLEGGKGIGRPTVGSAVRSYRESPFFQRLRSRTQRDYDRCLNFLAPLDRMPLAEVHRRFLVGVRSKAFAEHGWKFANDVVQIFSRVLDHSVEEDRIKRNPAIGIRKIPRPSDLAIANRAWTEAEFNEVMNAAPPHLRLPVAIARWAGLRQGDIIRLPKSAFDGKVLRLVTSKRNVPMPIACSDELITEILAAPASNAVRLCANSRGKPWTEDGFRTSFFKLIRRLEALELVGRNLTFHGLRTTYAEQLRLHGHDDRTISHGLGHSSTSATGRYLKNADRAVSLERIRETLNRNKR